MSKAIATKQTVSDLQVQAAHLASDENEVVASDVIVPRLLLMQGISPLVTQRKAQIGDIIRSTTGEKVSDPDKLLDLIPLKMENSWTNYAMPPNGQQGQPQFRGQEHRGAIKNAAGETVGSNEGLEAYKPFPGPNNETWIRKKTLTLYALLPSDVDAYEGEIKRAVESGEAPDLTKTLLPVVLTFQSTSFKYAGKKVASFFNDVKTNALALAGKLTIAPFQYVLELQCREEKKGANAWYVYDFTTKRKSVKDPKVREIAAMWTSRISGGSVQVDEVGEEAENATTTGNSESLI